MRLSPILALSCLPILSLFAIPPEILAPPPLAGVEDSSLELFVDAGQGRPGAKGTRADPLQHLGDAIRLLPDPLEKAATIHVAPGRYDRTSSDAAFAARFSLQRRMLAPASVRVLGERKGFTGPAEKGAVVIDWEGTWAGYLIPVLEGRWILESLQVGSRRPSQREGILVEGPALMELKDVRIRTSSFSGAGLQALRAGRIHLRGEIELNEDLHDRQVPESFSCIRADDHGTVQCRDPQGTLSIGNGQLSSSYYGCIRLGCRWARVTSWNRQSNCIAVNDSGRVDLHGTETTLCAQDPANTPIGPEDDGHILAEGAHIIILGKGNGQAIALQKASTLYCNDVEVRGDVKRAIAASSASSFVGGFLGDLGPVTATTGATVYIGKCTGKLRGPFHADRLGGIALYDGKILR